MEQLRIHRTRYRNTGKANRALRGKTEYHAIFKFDTEQKAKDFIEKVKDWFYGTEIINEPNEQKNEKTEVVEKPRRKPGPAKGQGGRPSKKNI